MAHRSSDTLIAWTKVLAPAFTNPGFVNALLVFGGWALTRGTHTTTQALVELGHVWIVVAVCVRLPFSRRTWALPILPRLYRPESACKRDQPPFKTKTQLAHEMLAIVA